MIWHHRGLFDDDQFIKDVMPYAETLGYTDSDIADLLHIVNCARDLRGVIDGYAFFQSIS
jgi:hypothetical protein